MGSRGKVAGGGDTRRARPMRADAQRNRARILEAAEVVFAAEGIEVPVDVIAEKAGVGVGTLYRHFPTKEKLCEAILLERLVGLTADARQLADAADPGAAFYGFLDHMVEERVQAGPRGGGDRGGHRIRGGGRRRQGETHRRSACCCAGPRTPVWCARDVTAETVVNLRVRDVSGRVDHGDRPRRPARRNLLGNDCDGLRCRAEAPLSAAAP